MKAIVVLFLILLSCKGDPEYVQNKKPSRNFYGYGFILFSKSYQGSIRYMEFYPIVKTNEIDFVKIKLKGNIKNGIVIRVNNSSKLWQSLLKSTDVMPDEYGFYKKLIFLDYECEKEFNYDRPIPNIVNLSGKIFQTKIYDCMANGQVKINKYKIITASETLVPTN